MARSEKQRRIRRAAHDLAGLAYERELGRALSELEGHFQKWRAGEISCFRLSELVHEHHDGIARDLWRKYGGHPEMLLPLLIADGILSESELPEELHVEMRQAIQSMREFRKRFSDPPKDTEGESPEANGEPEE